MTGVIKIQGMEFYAYHGYYPEEQERGGWYKVDVTLETEIIKAAQYDELSGTFNYEMVYEIVKKEMEHSCKLIEHLAYNIVIALQKHVEGYKNLEVTVHKLLPPLPGKVEEASVTLKG